MQENTFSTLLTASDSTVYLQNLHALNNEAKKYVKLIKSSSSSIKLWNISANQKELSGNEKVIENEKGETSFNDVNLIVQISNAPFFDAMKLTKLKQIKLESLAVTCPDNFNALPFKQEKSKQQSHSFKILCQRCEKGTYPTNGVRHKLTKNQSTILENIQNISLTCEACPTGAICMDGGIKARENFHGFQNNEKQYSFL